MTHPDRQNGHPLGRHTGRHKADAAILLALAVGATAEAAASHAGVSPSTVFRRLRDETFRRRLAEAKGELVQRTIARLSSASLEAVEALRGLLSANGEGTRLAAAKAVLELAIKAREAGELEARIERLEGQEQVTGRRGQR